MTLLMIYVCMMTLNIPLRAQWSAIISSFHLHPTASLYVCCDLAFHQLNLFILSESLFFTALQGDDDWTVTYTPDRVCALGGSTVGINCTYQHPNKQQDGPALVESLWFTEHNQPGGLISDTAYAGRVEHSCEEPSCTLSTCSGTCTLRISDLRQSDSAQYKVRLRTNQPDGRHTGDPGVTLTVTGELVLLMSQLNVCVCVCVCVCTFVCVCVCVCNLNHVE